MLGAAVALPLAVRFRSWRPSRRFSRARMISFVWRRSASRDMKLVGTHVGVSIGEDGPSQMGLEDLAMMSTQPGVTVLYPSDGLSMYRLMESAAAHKGMSVYLRRSSQDAGDLWRGRNLRIGGSRFFGRAPPISSRLWPPVSRFRKRSGPRSVEGGRHRNPRGRFVQHCSRRSGDLARLRAGDRWSVPTVEDHYAHGGIGDAVLSALASEGAGS